MSARRQPRGLSALERLVLAVALLEVAIERIAVPMLRPATGAPPAWHVALDYAGLFLFYFTGALATFVLVGRCIAALREPLGRREQIAHGITAIAAVLAAAPLVIAPPVMLTAALEAAFAAAVIALVATGLGRGDRAFTIGLAVVAVPLLLHAVRVLGERFFGSAAAFDWLQTAGPTALAAVALVSPYVFAPRPFSRSAARPGPVLLAMIVAALGALAARLWYARVAQGTSLAIGLALDTRGADPRLALYLLAVATLAWTFASCAIAPSPARRAIGAGLAFVVLGGYAFQWPSHFLLPMLGLAMMVRAARDVRAEETSAIAHVSPRIDDAVWAAYVTALAGALERTLAGVHSLTSRGEGHLASTIVTGEAGPAPVRVRIERIDGVVIAIDVVIGREIDEVRGATLALWAIPSRGRGQNPSGPAAAPRFASGDAAFDQRFEVRGSALAFQTMFDAALRARAIDALDGWLAYWEREGVRYRVYPGRGAPLEQPIPLAQLAAGSPAAVPPTAQLAAAPFAALIELLVELAARASVAAVGEPALLARDVS